jgi:LysR family glycine cleavage system transcriptional activator
MQKRYILSSMREKNSLIPAKLPPLNSLRIFEAAARHQSFVRAADELHLTHGAVSRQVRTLEAHLAVALFERRNRAVFLTGHGTVLLEACADMLARLSQAVHTIKGPGQQRPLVLSCEPTLAIRWLIPRLPAYRALYPAHPVHLLTAGGKVDFAREHVDLALRRNDFNWGEQCHAEPVGAEMIGPVCVAALAPAAAAHAPAAAFARLLHSRTRPHAWRQWQEATGQPVRSAESEHFEHFYLSLQAASAGLGVAIGSAYMVGDDLRDGRLVAPCGFVPDGSHYMLLSPVAFDQDERRAHLLDWVRKEMAQSGQDAGLLSVRKPAPAS